MSPTPATIREVREGCLWERRDVAALRELNPRLAETWAGERYSIRE